MNFNKKIIGTFVIGCCLLGSLTNQTFAANKDYSISYKKSGSIVHELSKKNNHFSAEVHCKADRNQKYYVQVLKKGKWVQFHNNSKGTLNCSKSKAKKKIFGDVMRKKGDKVRLYFENPGKSNVELKIKITEHDI